MKHFALVLMLGFSVAACDGSERRSPLPQPSPFVPAPEPAPPTPPAVPVIRSVELVGPQVVPLDETVQFSLIGHLSDGSGRDLTNEAQWSGAQFRFEDLMSFSGPGLVTGLAAGETAFRATFEEHYGWKQVMVLPAGTFRLMGQVNEADLPTGPVPGALVEVTDGVGRGLFTHTDLGGFFRLYGVSGKTSLRVHKEGYQPAARTVVVADHQPGYTIELPLLGPRADVSGTYTLTISAADNCGVGLGDGRLPAEARIRKYTAAVRQDGPTLSITLSGAKFRRFGGPSDYAGISGRVEPGRVVFDFPWWDGEAPYLVEELPTAGFLVVWGSAVTTGSGSRHVGMLSAHLQVYETPALGVPQVAWCLSASHHFELSR